MIKIKKKLLKHKRNHTKNYIVTKNVKMVGVNYTETIVATLEFVRSRIFSLTRNKIYVFIPIKK